MLSAGTPFVFLDDARPGGLQRLYRAPERIIVAHAPDEVAPALRRLREGVASGLHAAGYLAYAAGHALHARLAPLARSHDQPLLWFGLFAREEALARDALPALLGDPDGAWVGAIRPGIDRARYDAMLDQVQALIAAGDIYQANVSFRSELTVLGAPAALYARLRQGSRAGWGGIVHDGARWLLSFSPEMFFRIDGDAVTARPMKGTAPRGRDPSEDAANAARLAADPKERAENLMIVDLLRNDLSRVAVPGSVRVPRLFEVERYPTVQQMVSEVEARLAPGRDAVDVLEALFPCGSITGAPKLRAMEVIDAVEADERGAYTGSIGRMTPDGNAAFNVAIRTLVIGNGGETAQLGLGSAVVADSTAAGEWRECLAKGAFTRAGDRPFDLIETIRFDPDEGLLELDRHVDRLAASARTFGIPLDRHELRNELHMATFRLDRPARVRLRVSPTGLAAIESGPLPPPRTEPLTVRIVPLPVDPSDFRLRHKTSDRAFYDDARRSAGTDEVLFAPPDGRLTEGSFTSLFVRRDGRLATPPLHLGLLPGILRAALIEEGRAAEAELRADDLGQGFLLGNALRGLMAARLA